MQAQAPAIGVGRALGRAFQAAQGAAGGRRARGKKGAVAEAAPTGRQGAAKAAAAAAAKTAAGTAAADTASTAANTAKAATAADSKTKPTASSAKKAAVTPKPAELPLPSLPNPIQEFSSLADLTSALGFSPLALPENSTFTATAFLKIDATLADIRYTAPAEKDGTAAQTL